MPTAQQPRGANLDLYVKEQADFKTAATGNYETLPCYSWPLMEEQPLEDDPLLGTPTHNTRDQIEPALGLPSMAGQAIVPMDFTLSGRWLKGLLGAASTSGTSPNFSHVFESGKVVLPEVTAERKLAKASGNIFIQQRGIMVNTMNVRAVRESGYARLTLGLVGYGEFNLGVSSGAGTPTAMLPRDPVPASIGVYKIDNVDTAVLEVNLTFSNNLVELPLSSDERPSGFDLGDSSLGGSIRIRFRDMTLYDAAVAGTEHSGTLLFQKNANREFRWLMQRCRLQKTGVAVEGPGGIDQTFTLRCNQYQTLPMLVATLKGGGPSY